MIALDDFVFYYTDVEKPALDHISLKIQDGAFVLVTGPSGSGKTTFLRVLNGLVPHFYGGRIGGNALVYGLEAKEESVRRLSASVGMVFQDSTAQFVTDTVEGEIAFGLENIGLAGDEIARRVDETAGLMGIKHLIGRQAATLSGGERQKAAVASVMAMRPRVLALDEPTAELDPDAAGELLELLIKLNRERGLTVILAEHRLERVVQFADSIIELRSGKAEMGPTSEMAESIVNAPPVIELGRKMGWHPPPLSVEAARERIRLEPLTPTLSLPAGRQARRGREIVDKGSGPNCTVEKGPDPKTAVCAHGLSFSYDANKVLENINLTFNDGQITALMGPNGAGKTTMLKLLCGLLKPASGSVTIGGLDTAKAKAADVFRIAGYVPQRPGALLFADSVEEEVASAASQPRNDGITRARELIDDFGLAGHEKDYPRDLSQGEQQRVALAAILANDPEIILFDEPTHGLDFAAKKAVSERLRGLADGGKAVILATHDVETAARAADRVIVIDGGKVAADGRPKDVMPKTPMLRTQMNEIFGGKTLTVEDVTGK
ncbi:MAG: ATP-binding cassette domain-containing protein [Actinomycetota bacterium]